MKLTYDIVGSFLRPEAIKNARKDFKEGKITREELTKVEDKEIAALVEKEVAHKLPYVTDGEFRRRWWHLDWLKEFDGFETKHLTKEINGTINEIELGVVTGKVFYDKNKKHPEVEAWDYLHSLAQKYEGVTAKKCISGPNMIFIDHFLQLGNKETPYYGTNVEALIDDVAKAYQDLAVVLLAVADKTIRIPAGQAMKVDSEEVPGSKENKTEEKQAAKDTKSVKKSITIEQVRAVMAEKSQAGLTFKVKELLEKYGANKLSAVNPDDYADLMEEAAQLK